MMNNKIIEILVKAIPVKALDRDYSSDNGVYEEWGKCPICGGTVAYNSQLISYCEYCGQAIEWSGDIDDE